MSALRIVLCACAACVAYSTGVTKLTFGQDVDYPPYAYKTDSGELAGFGKDIADGMTALCDDLEITVVETPWSKCWNGDGAVLGDSLEDGTLDACMTYTHTEGIRNEYAEFSHAILQVNKAAGLISLLKDGEPVINGHSDLAGVKVIDVAGWAPTADGLEFVENKCTDQPYSDHYILLSGDGNDESMRMLRNGTAQAMFVYSDQAKNYQCKDGVVATWDCNLWKGFGTDYAYVQTGQFGYVQNGTTLALAKLGSGVADQINPCLDKFLLTKEYYDLCVKYDFVDHCYHNSFFPAKDDHVAPYNVATDYHTGDCSTGYCPCTGGAIEACHNHCEIDGVVSKCGDLLSGYLPRGETGSMNNAAIAPANRDALIFGQCPQCKGCAAADGSGSMPLVATFSKDSVAPFGTHKQLAFRGISILCCALVGAALVGVAALRRATAYSARGGSDASTVPLAPLSTGDLEGCDVE